MNDARKADPVMRPTIALLPSAHPGWLPLRVALANQSDIEVVGDIVRRRVSAPAACQPTVILAAADFEDTVALADELRMCYPDSALIMLGPTVGLDATIAMALNDRGVRGYLLWEDMRSSATIRRAIDTVRETNLLVGSPVVLAQLRAALERRHGPRVEGLVLTPVERAIDGASSDDRVLGLKAKELAVLEGLAAERTREQIANDAGVCVRTIDERIAVLKEKFGTPTMFMLGVRTERPGLIRCRKP